MGYNSAGEHQLQSAEHDGTPRGFRNEAERAEVECPPHAVAVLARRKNDDRYGWIALLQVGEHVEAVAVRQIQVEQNQLEVGMLLDELHRLAAIRSFQNGSIALPFPENALQRLANQHMIINH